MKRTLRMTLALALLLLGGGAVFLLTRPPPEPAPPWEHRNRSGIQTFLDTLFSGGRLVRLDAEFVAICARLRNVTGAQAQFQGCAYADEDRDGLGEYGTFAELSGVVAVRGTDRVILSPTASAAWTPRNEAGNVHLLRYEFQMFLPGPKGRAVTEVGGEILPAGAVDPDLAENAWFCVARPAASHVDFKWSYLITESGDIWGKHGRVEFEDAARFDPETGVTVPFGDGWIMME